MPRSASKLASTREGGFIARKVIPFDVRNDYAKLYGQRTEERLNTGPMPVLLARAKRRITRWKHEAVLEKVQDRLDHNPAAMGVRRQTVEHPFGTIKMLDGMDALSYEEAAQSGH